MPVAGVYAAHAYVSGEKYELLEDNVGVSLTDTIQDWRGERMETGPQDSSQNAREKRRKLNRTSL